MPDFLSRYATPFTTGLFLVSLISGVALFFHIGGGAFHGMHEWLSMVLILPFILHLWKNWRPLAGYFKRLPMLVALLLSAAAAAAFVVPSGGEHGGRPPQRVMFDAIGNGSVTQVAPLFGQTPDALLAALQKGGFKVSTPEERLSAIAKASNRSLMDVIKVVGAGTPRAH